MKVSVLWDDGKYYNGELIALNTDVKYKVDAHLIEYLIAQLSFRLSLTTLLVWFATRMCMHTMIQQAKKSSPNERRLMCVIRGSKSLNFHL